MITKDDIKNLADLARIEVSSEEAEKLTSEMDSVLEYVGQIKDAVGNIEKTIPGHRNIMREDIPTNKPGQFKDDLLGNAPLKEGDYVKVKKIL